MCLGVELQSVEVDRPFDFDASFAVVMHGRTEAVLIRGTSMKRAKVKGLLRNLMVVAGNSGLRSLIPKVQRF